MYSRTNNSNGMDRKKSSCREVTAQVIAVLVKNTVLMGFGMTLGFPTILVHALSDPKDPLSTGIDELSWLGSINLIFVPIGCLISGSLSQKLGRKTTIQLANIPLTFVWLLFKFSTKMWQVYLGLAVSGLLLGCIEASVIIYVAEITTPKLRGMLSSTSTMFTIMGVLLELLLGAVFHWRDAALLSITIPLISLNTLILVPESPHWLLMKKRYEDTRYSLAWLRGWVTFQDVEKEYRQMIREVNQKQLFPHRRVGECWLKAYTRKSFLWPFALVTFLFFLRHFTGITNVQTYGIKLFATYDVPFDSYYTAVIMGAVELFGCITCFLVISRTGRRVLAFVTILCSALCLSGIASYSLIKGIDDLRVITTTSNNNTTGIKANIAGISEISVGNVSIYSEAEMESKGVNNVTMTSIVDRKISKRNLIFHEIATVQKNSLINLKSGSKQENVTPMPNSMRMKNTGFNLKSENLFDKFNTIKGNNNERNQLDVQHLRKRNAEKFSQKQESNGKLDSHGENENDNLRVLNDLRNRNTEIFAQNKESKGKLDSQGENANVNFRIVNDLGKRNTAKLSANQESYPNLILHRQTNNVRRHKNEILNLKVEDFIRKIKWIKRYKRQYSISELNFLDELNTTRGNMTENTKSCRTLRVKRNSTPVKNENKNSTANAIDSKLENWIPTGLLLAFSFFSHAGLRILPWILTGEVFTPETRSLATGVTTATAYIMGFGANKLFLFACRVLTLPGVFFFYSCLSLLGVLVLYFVLPNTEGKSLEEIRMYFGGTSEKDCNYNRRTMRVSGDLYAINWDMINTTEDANSYKKFTEVDTPV